MTVILPTRPNLVKQVDLRLSFGVMYDIVGQIAGPTVDPPHHHVASINHKFFEHRVGSGKFRSTSPQSMTTPIFDGYPSGQMCTAEPGGET
jgi:hypothetical protein